MVSGVRWTTAIDSVHVQSTHFKQLNISGECTTSLYKIARVELHYKLVVYACIHNIAVCMCVVHV